MRSRINNCRKIKPLAAQKHKDSFTTPGGVQSSYSDKRMGRSCVQRGKTLTTAEYRNIEDAGSVRINVVIDHADGRIEPGATNRLKNASGMAARPKTEDRRENQLRLSGKEISHNGVSDSLTCEQVSSRRHAFMQ